MTLRIRTGKNFFNYILVCFIVVVSTTPMLSIRIPMIVKICILLLWFLSVMLKRRKIMPVRQLVVITLALLAISYLYRILGISSAAWGNYANELYFYSSIWIMLYIESDFDGKEKKRLAYVCYFVLLINLVSNIAMFFLLPRYTSWSYVSATKMEEYVRLYNLGSTSFVTTITLFSGIVFILAVSSTSLKKKIVFGLTSLTAIVYLVVCSGRATAIILLSLMFALFYLYKNKRVVHIVPFVLLVIVFTFFLFGDYIIGLVAEIVPNERIAVRLQAIGDYISGSNRDSIYLARIEIIGLSISTWLSNLGSFLFGIGDHRYLAGNLNDIYTIGISGHSDYFDFLPKYGLIGFSLLNLLFSCLFSYFRKRTCCSEKQNRYFTIVLFIFVLRSLFGSVFSTDIAVVIFIFTPVAYKMVAEGENDL